MLAPEGDPVDNYKGNKQRERDNYLFTFPLEFRRYFYKEIKPKLLTDPPNEQLDREYE